MDALILAKCAKCFLAFIGSVRTNFLTCRCRLAEGPLVPLASSDLEVLADGTLCRLTFIKSRVDFALLIFLVFYQESHCGFCHYGIKRTIGPLDLMFLSSGTLCRLILAEVTLWLLAFYQGAQRAL